MDDIERLYKNYNHLAEEVSDLAKRFRKHENTPVISAYDFALGTILGYHLNIPYLRGLWNFASRDDADNLYDNSPEQRHLSNLSAYGTYHLNGLVPYLSFSGLGGVRRADEPALCLTTTMSMGGWFWLDALATSALICKWTAAGNQRSYLLYYNSLTGVAGFYISTNGQAAGEFGILHTTVLELHHWYHICGTFYGSNEMNIFLNGEKVQTVAAVPASAFIGTSPFEIGGSESSTLGLLDGRAAFCWISGGFQPDTVITNLYERSRALFEV